MQDRITFLYVERSTVSRDANAITATSKEGTVHIPGATLGALLMGPGTRITHHAVMLLADCGVSVVWVGEAGVRYYAHGSPIARSTRLLEAQAAAVSNTRSRLSVARRMYEMRFPDEVVEGLNMQQLRGREGARVRGIYRQESARSGVPWTRRDYDSADFEASDPINKALSAAHSCLYGIVHAAVVALGCSPGLGFVHTGHSRAFVYDIADLYKAEVTIPIAFEVAAQEPENVGAETRRAVREALRDGDVLVRTVRDIKALLMPGDDESDFDIDAIYLWDEKSGTVAGGVSYDEVPW